MTIQRICSVFYEEISPYQRAWQKQKDWVKQRLEPQGRDIIFACQHPATLTIGKSGKRENILVTDEYLEQRGITVIQIERGGDVTLHNPGQLVVYPIIRLLDYKLSVPGFVQTLEDSIIATLADFDIPAGRRAGYPGVWVGQQKIASIGLKITHWVTMHGLALNVNNDLSLFQLINPCGMPACRMTSMEQIAGRRQTVKQVLTRFLVHLGDCLNCQLVYEQLDNEKDHSEPVSG
ncbi:lipoyl(octanoyl) transferase LipB [bacterium]|nr:lipoyl(octanoyl) transferase LipB [bacterium]